MRVLGIFVRLLEGMFVAGGLGSLLVLLLTGIEDIETLLGPKSKEPSKEAPAS